MVSGLLQFNHYAAQFSSGIGHVIAGSIEPALKDCAHKPSPFVVSVFVIQDCSADVGLSVLGELFPTAHVLQRSEETPNGVFGLGATFNERFAEFNVGLVSKGPFFVFD